MLDKKQIKLNIRKKKRGHSDAHKQTAIYECGDCPAICCHDLTIAMKKPRTNAELDTALWHMNYENVAIYVRNRRWYLLVKSKCRYLGDNNLCSIYDRRFDICKKHKPPLCERFDEWYDFIFTTPEALDSYIRAERKGGKPPKPRGRWTSKGA